MFDSYNTPSEFRSAVAALASTATGGVFTAEKAERVWRTSPATTQARLRRLVVQGWVRRLRRGVYLILPIDVLPGAGDIVEDPWVLAQTLFAPCYIGGWSAAHHWNFTEQLFQTTFVVSAANLRKREVDVGGATFRIAKVPLPRVKRSVSVWRGSTKARISDRELTIIDGLADPAWLGGFRQLVEVVRAYHASDTWNAKRLLARLSELDRGAVYKRMGFISELLSPIPSEIVGACMKRRTAGLVALDPAVHERGRIFKRWGVRVNVGIEDLREAP